MNSSPLTAPLNTQGATRPSWRKPAMKVEVRQRPKGTALTTRLPRQAKQSQGLTDQPAARRYLMGLSQPDLQLADRRVRMLGHPRGDLLIQRCQLRLQL